MVSFEELKRYVLTIREEEMNNNYKLSDSQVKLITKVNQELKKDPDLRIKLKKILSSKSVSEMNNIEFGQSIQVKSNVVEFKKQEDANNQIENGRQFTLKDKKRAGYVDALVMALVTGFVGGIATTVILMMCK